MSNYAQYNAPLPPAPRQDYTSRLATWGIVKLIQLLLLWPILLAASAFPTLASANVRRRLETGEQSRHPFLNAVSIFIWRSGLVLAASVFMPLAVLITGPLTVLVIGKAAAAPMPMTSAQVFSTAWGTRQSNGVRIGLIAAGITALTGAVLYAVTAFTGSGSGAWLYTLMGAAAVVFLTFGLTTHLATKNASRVAHEAAMRRDELVARIAAAVGVNPKSLAEGHSVEVHADGSWNVTPAPVSGLGMGAQKLEENVGRFFPELTVIAFDSTVIAAGTATQDVLDARQAVAESGGLIVGFEDVEDTILRPEAAIWHLAEGTSPARADAVDALARKRSLSLVEWQPFDGVAHVAKLEGTVRQVRDAIAGALGCRPWDVEVSIESGEDRAVASVSILRMPQLPAARRQQAWAEALQLIPGGHADWDVVDDGHTAKLTYAVVRVLPDLVPLASLQPVVVTPKDWHTLPVGLDDRGSEVCIQLKLGPGSLYVGPIGSGKTIALVAHATSALLRGHELILVDPMKEAADFSTITPWARHVSATIDDAAATLMAVYEEGQRRKRILVQHGTGSWSDLSPEVRAAENVVPLTMIVDEYTSLALPVPVPKGLDKEHPLIVEAEQQNAAKSILTAYTGKVIRELRFVGIFTVLATQRADAAWVGGEMRSNLTSGVQLSKPGDIPAREALAMIFSGDQVNAAATELATLDDGRSRGLAVVGADGGSVRGLRVAFAPERERPEILSAVPKPQPFVVPPLDLGGDEGDTSPRKRSKKLSGLDALNDL